MSPELIYAVASFSCGILVVLIADAIEGECKRSELTTKGLLVCNATRPNGTSVEFELRNGYDWKVRITPTMVKVIATINGKQTVAEIPIQVNDNSVRAITRKPER